jgi:hypothetical protein
MLHSKEIYYLIKIDLLSEKNFSINSLDSYNRKQDVNKVYRRIDGEYILIECKYTEDWDLNKKRSVAKQISSEELGEMKEKLLYELDKLLLM